ncbi:unnamed protein product [Arctia plantaginis]|uniref:Uncharacterized protein n=1 Tax=Arctia plantaginis TaxID=874455 RepID=A0A8S0ZPN8_ARCPL|nr:unnamed protein product [Arctia plantaginis]
MFFSYIFHYILSGYLAAPASIDTPKNGLLLLYRPLDVSNECAFSGHLRYDLSFGMGMSDTITMIISELPKKIATLTLKITTQSVLIEAQNKKIDNQQQTINHLTKVIEDLSTKIDKLLTSTSVSEIEEPTKMAATQGVLRTLNGIDYECSIEIAAQSTNVYLIVVIKFPTNLLKNCFANEDAFMAEMYQVTATTARKKPLPGDCQGKNETLCVIDHKEYCFTNGVVCDGIINCGAKDWFDERQAECSLPVEYLGYAPTIAVVGALACTLLAAGHILVRCLPAQASSFFIFNANEDNRLRIDPLLCPPKKCDMYDRKSQESLFDTGIIKVLIFTLP